jgi:catechol 2,3-dioxygenase-like lactoylglutathione lyase family enzyme
VIVDLERNFRSVERYDATARLSHPAPSSISNRVSSLSSCAEVQKRRSVTPLFATLTQTPGMGCHRRRNFLLDAAIEFCSPFVFKNYKSLFPQPLSFHIHTKPPGVSPTPMLDTVQTAPLSCSPTSRPSPLFLAVSEKQMISGAHVILYSKNSDADRAFFRDVLGFQSVDAGNGWLIFALPPAEAAFHPSDENGLHELYFLCDDLEAEIASLAKKHVKCSEVQEERWGSITKMQLPGGGGVRLYQPKHPTALHLGKTP